MTANAARREWLKVIGSLAVTSPTLLTAKGNDENISPAEDLMREHGVLKRVLLIYREVMNRIDSKRDFPPDVVMSSAKLIRSFVEDYHEKLEENYLFPRFRKANKLVDLVNVLNLQHQKGRLLTDRTMQLASPSVLKDGNQRADLRNMLFQFVRMYEPHEARKIRSFFLNSEKSYLNTNTSNWVKSSKRRRISYFTAMDSKKMWMRSPGWKNNLAFMT